MIGKLRKKLMIVLMIILSLLLVAILGGMFYSAKVLYERRNTLAFTDPPPAETKSDQTLRLAIPIAAVLLEPSGRYTVTQNQIHYVSNEELLRIAQSLRFDTAGFGTVSNYDLRYRQHLNADGSITYFFSDTFLERDSLQAQILSSVVIGIGALSLFLLVSILLSRWMVKPVEKAWEKQRQFIADASHELKTPLTVILSNTDMLIEAGAVKGEKNQVRLDNIRAESKRMKALTENLLDLARTDSKPKAVRKEPVNLSFLISGAALVFEPTIFDLGRSLRCEIQENITVSGNRERLRQLADILLENALQYGADKSPITVRLASAGKREALLSVTSEGAPLSAQDCASIFERFYRMDASRGQTRGFGLGLSIARSIAQEHGGKIWAESDGKSLNTFFVKLPAQNCT